MTDEENPGQIVHQTSSTESPVAPRLLHSEELFRGQRVLIIEHAGERYVLQITPRNRLLLQK